MAFVDNGDGTATLSGTPASGSQGTYDITITATNDTGSVNQSFTLLVLAPGHYYPLTPFRILDTRIGTGAPKAKLGPGGTLNLQVTGVDGIPAGAQAVVLNVTVTNTTASSYLTVWPEGETRPTASNLNFVAGETVPNLVEVALSPSGQVSIFNDLGSTDVVADVEGYVDSSSSPTSTAGLFNPLPPARILDTRTTTGGHSSPLGPGQRLDLQVTGNGGVPDEPGVSAVVLNVTVTDTTSLSYLTVWPQGETRPTASNLNFVAGETVPNRVIVPVSSTGKVSIFNDLGSTNVVVDVGGWYTDGSNPSATGDYFTPAATPTRILDTRIGTGHSGKIGANTYIDLQVSGSNGIPVGADAVVANTTVTNTSAASYLTVYPAGPPAPTASDLNWSPGETVPNLVVAKLSPSGQWSIYNNQGTTDAVSDVAGWYLPQG